MLPHVLAIGKPIRGSPGSISSGCPNAIEGAGVIPKGGISSIPVAKIIILSNWSVSAQNNHATSQLLRLCKTFCKYYKYANLHIFATHFFNFSRYYKLQWGKTLLLKVKVCIVRSSALQYLDTVSKHQPCNCNKKSLHCTTVRFSLRYLLEPGVDHCFVENKASTVSAFNVWRLYKNASLKLSG